MPGPKKKRFDSCHCSSPVSDSCDSHRASNSCCSYWLYDRVRPFSEHGVFHQHHPWEHVLSASETTVLGATSSLASNYVKFPYQTTIWLNKVLWLTTLFRDQITRRTRFQKLQKLEGKCLLNVFANNFCAKFLYHPRIVLHPPHMHFVHGTLRRDQQGDSEILIVKVDSRGAALLVTV